MKSEEMAPKVRLRYWRERKVMTQRELAAKSGVGLATVVRLEQGQPARVSTIRKLAASLGVEPEVLMEPEA